MYVLKTGKWTESEEKLEKEIYFNTLCKDIVPAPRILFEDHTDKHFDRTNIIFEKVQGDNLYAKWHEYNTTERRALIKEISGYLRAINALSYSTCPPRYFTNSELSWKENVLSRVSQYADRALKSGAISEELCERAVAWVSAHSAALSESKMVLNYLDIHFDNFIVSNAHITGMLDFELTDVTSVDFTMDIVQRMVLQPTKYASEFAAQFIKAKDYADLMDMYRDYYPEAFQFQDFDTRLGIYSVLHDLEQIHSWPMHHTLGTSLERVLC